MIAWRFLAFAAAVAVVMYLHFLLAHYAWRRSKGKPSLELDRGYVRMEDYFGRSFRLKVREWLKSAGSPRGAVWETTTARAGERLRCVPTLALPDASSEDAVLVVQSDFSCGTACRLEREIYARGDGQVGDRSHLQAIATDGALTLGAGVSIGRWADSEGDLEIGPGASVGGRVSSRGAVRVSAGARAQSLFGRVIEVKGATEPAGSEGERLPEESVEIPSDTTARPAVRNNPVPGFDLSRLSQLSADTWVYRGDLCPSVRLEVTSKLIVKGDCRCPAGTRFHDDVKVSGSLELGPVSVAGGNLIARGRIALGPHTRFEGVIHAGECLHLGVGVSGGRNGARVAAFARRVVYLGEGVRIADGKIAAGEYVVAARQQRTGSKLPAEGVA